MAPLLHTILVVLSILLEGIDQGMLQSSPLSPIPFLTCRRVSSIPAAVVYLWSHQPLQWLPGDVLVPYDLSLFSFYF
jgi:hypothetical protein